MRPSDTTLPAFAYQLEVFRRMGGPARLRCALEMSDLTRELCLSGIRKKNPGYTRAECVAAFIRDQLIRPATAP